ncbi:MAG: SMR family transporter, partial [Pseudomonadota bacterium]
GIACYAVSLVLWIVALSRVEVSVAYPMASVGYVVTAAAWLLPGENVNAMRLAGIAIIIVGVFVVAKS